MVTKYEAEAIRGEVAAERVYQAHKEPAAVQALGQKTKAELRAEREAEAYYRTCDELLAAWPEKA